MKKEENYYELLKVNPRATMAEIVAAYHAARNAFSKDSLAVYSLFSPEETEQVLKKLEEAYFTLSNIDRKRDYDKRISGAPTNGAPGAAPQTYEADSAPDRTTITASSQPEAPSGPVDGRWLAITREQRGMSLDDVARLTKIPSKFLKAIETNDVSHLPVRVYLQGFITNLAKTYRLDPASTTKAYLENLDRLLSPSSG